MDLHAPSEIEVGGFGSDLQKDFLPAPRGTSMDPRTSNVNNRPRVSLSRAAALSPTSGVATTVSWDTSEYDVESMWNGTDTFTIRTPGVWGVTAWIGWAAAAGGFRQIYILKNGTITINPIADSGPAAGSGTAIMTSANVQLAKGDTLQCVIAQTSGAGLAITVWTTTAYNNGFQAVWLSPI